MAKVINRLYCRRCGHRWSSTQERPVVCPRCKSYKWDEKLKVVKGK